MTDNKITISKDELASAMKAVGFNAAEYHAEKIFAEADRQQAKLPETITADELRGAVRKLVKESRWGGAFIDYNQFKTSDEFADALLREAKTPEPEFVTGGVYRSANGRFYKRVADGWQVFGSAARANDYIPARPLERVDK